MRGAIITNPAGVRLSPVLLQCSGRKIIDSLLYFYIRQRNTVMKIEDIACQEGFKNSINTGTNCKI